MARLPSLCRISLRNLYQPVACKSNQNGLRSLTATKVFKNETDNLSQHKNCIQNTFSTNIGVTRGFASKNDEDIGTFLSDEIAAEKGNFKRPEIPKGGFEVKTDGAEVTFTKSSGNEKIVISMNVNHTVDSAEPDDGSEEAPEMKSKPNFEVDIVKTGGKTLSFSCSFAPPPEVHDPQAPSEEAYDDTFVIDEVTMFEGENWSDKTYAVAGDILDGYLYDLFMNMLDERGVNKEFVEKMSDFCSSYEHERYISLLEDLQKFVK